MRKIAFLAAAAGIVVSGCSSYSTIKGPLPAAEDAKTLHVTLADGSSTILKKAYAEGDSLYGRCSETTARIELRQVKSLEYRDTFSDWTPLDVVPSEASRRRRLRVTMTNGSTRVFDDAYVDGEVLYGTCVGWQAVSVPLADVEKAEEKHTSPMKIMGLVLLIASPIAAFIAVCLTFESSSFN